MATVELNSNWNTFQEDDRYATALAPLQEITITTTLNNTYVYHRNCTTDHNDIIANEWTGTKNGVTVLAVDENDDIIVPNEPEIYVILTLDTILTMFYETVDPVTLIPYETPTYTKLN